MLGNRDGRTGVLDRASTILPGDTRVIYVGNLFHNMLSEKKESGYGEYINFFFFSENIFL